MSASPLGKGCVPVQGRRRGRAWAVQGLGLKLGLALLLAGGCSAARAQVGTPTSAPALDAVTQQLARLAAVVAQQGAQLEQSQAEIRALRQQLAALQGQASAGGDPANAENTGTQAAAALAQQIAALREQQQMQASQLATHEQTKAESASKYPLTLTGLLLANGFHNSGGVDVIQSPALAAAGAGSTGISLRQTVLGLDARGPHLLGALTHADVRVDFFGGGATASVAGYGDSGGLLRMRTAHATMDWTHAQAFAELDRPLLSPDTPTSLTALAQPALAWSGNLWSWIPQFGGSYRHPVSQSSGVTVEAALADVPDPPGYAVPSTGAAVSANAGSYAEQSQWPGSELRLAYARQNPGGLRFGAGGYFSPHRAPGFYKYDAWAATVDYQVPLTHGLALNGAFYRGLALGGLGGGAYKDTVFTISPSGQYTFRRPLDDVGGWSQLKARAGERLEFNAAFGLDDAFARELRPYAAAGGGSYANLVRNATFFGNVIYSPTAYTLFSFEYRRLNSAPVTGPGAASNVYGLAAGYKF